MTETADIVIAGAGVVGLCAALQLARRTRARIMVLEKGVGLGEGSTGASSAVCRAKYTRDEMVRLARNGIAAYRRWADFLELGDPVAAYHEVGVVWMAGRDPLRPATEIERLRSLGVAADLLDDAALANRYPALNPCPIAPDLVGGEPHECTAGGFHLVETEGGYMDPMDVVQDLLRAVRQRGVEVRFRAEVSGVSTSGGAISGVRTGSGDIAGGTLVNAAGPWCSALDRLVGMESPWPLAATRIQIVHIDRPSTVIGPLPACADPAGGIYFRPQNRGQQIVVGSILEEDERETVHPDEFNRGVDDEFVLPKLHALQHRLRGLDVIRGVKGYSGLYTMSQADVHPIIGPTPVNGYYVANGFSGHGFKLAPAVGSLVAQAITGTSLPDDTDVGLDFLSFQRRPIEVATRSVLA